MTFNITQLNVTVERFNDPRYARPRYRLRYEQRQSFLKDGRTCGSYKLKRDAQKRADELNTVARSAGAQA